MYGMDSVVLNLGEMDNNSNGFELLDFFDTNNDNIDHFVNLIRGENEDPFAHFDDHDFTYHDDLISGSDLADKLGQLGPPALEPDNMMFGSLNAVTGLLSSNLDHHHGQTKGHDQYQDHDLTLASDDDDDEQESSEAETNHTESKSTAKNNNNNKSKVDRSKTLISERRRRGKMKEKLYALRSLVPNITKMDKASIVGDAARYVKELQMQAKKLKEEIGGLEASLLLGQDQRYKASTTTNNNNNAINNQRKFHRLVNSDQLMISKNVIQMDVFQVEERGFYLRLACNKGEGIAASIYKVLELLTSFNIQSSNLASAIDRLELTVTLRVKDSVRDINLPNLKLWVVGALLHEGFEFKSSFCL